MGSNVRQLLQQRKKAEMGGEETNERIEEAYQCLFSPAAKPASTPAKAEIRMIPLSKLHTFFTARIGFKAYSEADLRDFANGIAKNGLIERIKVRPIPGTDEYEILSGHNRTAAFRLLGMDAIPAEIENVDDNRAIIIATVPNLDHRQSLCPSERGWAYRSLLDAQKRQGKRTDLLPGTSVEIQQKFDARDEVARIFKVKAHEVQRDIRLTYLIQPLLDAVDEKKLKVSCGVILSYYDDASQTAFQKIWEQHDHICSLKTMKFIKKLCPAPTLEQNVLRSVWDAAEASDAKETTHQQTISISLDHALLSPYLERYGGEENLQAMFLSFLRTL